MIVFLSLKDLWIYSIKNMASQNECPEKVVGTDVESLFNMAELAKMRPDERLAYQMSMIHRIDYLNSRQEAIEEAAKEGHREGLEQGINHAIVQMAKSGLQIKDIASIMNLSEEKIADILSYK